MTMPAMARMAATIYEREKNIVRHGGRGKCSRECSIHGFFQMEESSVSSQDSWAEKGEVAEGAELTGHLSKLHRTKLLRHW